MVASSYYRYYLYTDDFFDDWEMYLVLQYLVRVIQALSYLYNKALISAQYFREFLWDERFGPDATDLLPVVLCRNEHDQYIIIQVSKLEYRSYFLYRSGYIIIIHYYTSPELKTTTRLSFVWSPPTTSQLHCMFFHTILLSDYFQPRPLNLLRSSKAKADIEISFPKFSSISPSRISYYVKSRSRYHEADLYLHHPFGVNVAHHMCHRAG
jgi:hypothetical protein